MAAETEADLQKSRACQARQPKRWKDTWTLDNGDGLEERVLSGGELRNFVIEW